GKSLKRRNPALENDAAFVRRTLRSLGGDVSSNRDHGIEIEGGRLLAHRGAGRSQPRAGSKSVLSGSTVVIGSEASRTRRSDCSVAPEAPQRGPPTRSERRTAYG